MSDTIDPTDPDPVEPVVQVSMIASVVYEEWPDGSRTARLSFWEEEPHVHRCGGEWLQVIVGDDRPEIVAARERMLDAFPEQEQALPALVMRGVRA